MPGCNAAYVCKRQSPYEWGFCTSRSCPGGNDEESKARQHGFDNTREALRALRVWRREQAARDERAREEPRRRLAETQAAEEAAAAQAREAVREAVVSRTNMTEDETTQWQRRNPGQVVPPWILRAAPIQERRERAARAAEQRQAVSQIGASSSASQPIRATPKSLPAHLRAQIPYLQMSRPAAPKNKPAPQRKKGPSKALRAQVDTLRDQVNTAARASMKQSQELRRQQRSNDEARVLAEQARSVLEAAAAEFREAKQLLDAEKAMQLRESARKRLKRSDQTSSPPRQKPRYPTSSSSRARGSHGSGDTSTPPSGSRGQRR